MGLQQGCHPSPRLFGIFLDGVHDHLRPGAPSAGMELGSRHSISVFAYVVDVALPS